LEFAGVGKCLPGFKEFYDFEVGDVFMYEFIGYYDVENDAFSNYYYFKMEVLLVEIINDTLMVTFDKKYRHVNYPHEGDIGSAKVTKKYINSCNHLSNTYPSQKIPICSYEFSDRVMESCDWSDEEVACTFIELKFSNGRYIKDIGYDDDYGDVKGPFFKDSMGLFTMSSNIDYDLNGIPLTYKWIFGEGIGYIRYEYFQFETQFGEELIGYVKGSDTTGTVYSDAFMTDLPMIQANEISIFPNPSTGIITFDLGNQPNATITIFSLDGKLVAQFATKSRQTHHLEYLESGVYIINVNYGKDLKQFKWIKR